ncbi:hypothetical protein [Streptococcus hyointestinalis]|uniref:hypothetical protein n=1 Tax=Streptococcus hyointestinalis TaxID=1337 RepID=UPI0023F9825C|nr:hypothetical protein [Streptococcus hyointestinalis]
MAKNRKAIKMLTPAELKDKIETTSLEEAIELFKESVLKKSLNNYDGIWQSEMTETFERIDYYDEPFFVLIEKNLGDSCGGLSSPIITEQEKIALFLLMVEVFDRFVEIQTVDDVDWAGNPYVLAMLIVSNEVAAEPLTQEEFEIIKDFIVALIDTFVPSLTVDTQEYLAFKSANNPDTTPIDNIQITLPLKAYKTIDIKYTLP